ncbi:MAG: ribonuclease HII [Chloroflexi bacterium]|nr:ribonuclease HII [Chloroflexota bacterium]
MPTLEFETAVLTATPYRYIAGLDEAGRGALAGPVAAAAVMLPLDKPDALDALREVNDSKQLSAKKRDVLFDLIIQHALAYGLGLESAEVIDEIGILPATKLAMQTAVSQLRPAAEYLLIDGRIRLQSIPLPQQAIIRGDSLSLSIAAASILAKVTRDRLMIALDPHHLPYGFAQHKGYGTAMHLAALEKLGPTPHHRHSFAPIRHTLL